MSSVEISGSNVPELLSAAIGFVSALVGAVVGAVVGGRYTLRAVRQQNEAERERDRQPEREQRSAEVRAARAILRTEVLVARSRCENLRVNPSDMDQLRLTAKLADFRIDSRPLSLVPDATTPFMKFYQSVTGLGSLATSLSSGSYGGGREGVIAETARAAILEADETLKALQEET